MEKFQGWSVRVPTKVSKTNDPEQTEWLDYHTRAREGGFEK